MGWIGILSGPLARLSGPLTYNNAFFSGSTNCTNWCYGVYLL